MSFFGKYLKKIDIFGAIPIDVLNFNKESEHNSSIGGCFTVCVGILVLAIASSSFIPIYNKSLPKLTTDLEHVTSDPIYLDDGLKPLIILHITDGVETFPIDPTKIEAYIEHATFDHFTQVYDFYQTENVKITKHEIKPC